MEPTKKRKTSFLKRKEPLAGRILAGKYRYLKVLGTGGMGEVHLVSDVDTGQKLAMKCCIEESLADRFEREVLSWIKLNRHPNLVRAIYFDCVDAVPTLFIEYVEGTSLKAAIEESAENKKDMPMNTVLDYGIQICRGMSHLHSHGIIHRDLKPSNILIAVEKDGPGRIKITDMGLSKLKGSAVMETTAAVLTDDIVLPDITNTKDMLGTPQYMSPQQYAYSKGVAEETDIYAFGVILYEMLAQGKRPFEEVSSQGWFYAHTFKTPMHVKRQVSSRFAIFHRKSRSDLYDLVMQCLSKKVSERPQTFKEIEERLNGFYEKICHENYSRDRHCKVGVPSYEDLNNRAVSLLEMGGDYVKEGWEKLGKVCESFPDGTEANLNRLLYELKTGQCPLHHFWYQGRKVLAEKPEDRQKIIATMIGAALEKGSYYRQSLDLLAKLTEDASIMRLDAKLMYLGENYQESSASFQNLAERECCLLEDFYHWAGAVTHIAIKDGRSRLCIDQNKFSVELDRPTKQQVWYILRRGEDICGTAPYLERSKDVAVGSLTPIENFWHETEALCPAGGQVRCVVLTADQKWALSGCDDKVILWDVEKRREFFRFEGHTGAVTGVAVDWEGKYGASGAKDGAVHIWDLKAQKLLDSFEHRAPVTRVALNSDKRLAISSAADGTVKVWNFYPEKRGFWKIFAQKKHCTFSPGCGEISAMAVGLDARYLLAGCQDGSIFRWEMTSPGKPTILRGHLGPVTCIAVSADGKWAVSSSNSPRDNVFIWNLETAEKHTALSVARNGIFSMAVAGNAHWIFAASDSSSIYVWDIKYAKQQVAILDGHTGTIGDLTATFQGDLVLSCGTDGSIRVWKNDYVWPLIKVQKYLKVAGPG